MVQLGTPGRMLALPGCFLAINLLESNLVTPLVLERRLALNAPALFVSTLFWWFPLGLPGAVLAVPLTVALKVLCDHVAAMAPPGMFLAK